jgi:hypothetical protein
MIFNRFFILRKVLKTRKKNVKKKKNKKSKNISDKKMTKLGNNFATISSKKIFQSQIMK